LIDFRYHVTSLVAVFIALAVGIVIGSGLVGGPSVRRQNTFIRQQIRDIQTRFNTLTRDIKAKDDAIRDLESELQRSEQLARAMMPTVLRGRLSGRSVAIIQTGDYKEATAAVQSVLKSAGANVTSVTRIVLPKEAKTLDASLPPDLDGQLAQLPAALTAAVVDGRGPNPIQGLADEGLLVLSGDYKRWNRLIVIVGGCRAEYPRLEVLEGALINELEARGATVVGCEPSNVAASSIATYQKEKISTIDNVDRAAGEIALAFALTGERGDYGEKGTAGRFLPRSVEASRSR